MTHRCDRYGHADFGLRIADCGLRGRQGRDWGIKRENPSIQNETGGISSCNGLFPMIKKGGCLLSSLVTLHKYNRGRPLDYKFTSQ